ncbi:MAG: HD domain-containing protein [Candidatus Rokubacteria bacterium]|nr:HD domain-containing protein [Candidatus Rokubacteria bacterium]
MAGPKGFRNLPKLERLKRGRPAPSPPPLLRRRGRPLPRKQEAPSPVIALAAFPQSHQRVLLEVLRLLGPSREAFLVGGAVRDILLARQDVEDLDLALSNGALEVARSLADCLGGAFVALDEARGAGRVVFKAEPGHRQVDLTDFRASALEADLRGRDFSVNAIAVPLGPLVRDTQARVVDPSGGLIDLARRRLRLAGPGVFEADPLRALRGVRLASQLGFSLDAQARRAARAVAPKLTTVSPERQREELVRLLSVPEASRALGQLDQLGLLEAVLPEIGPMKRAAQPTPHRFSVWEHSLRAVDAVDRLLADLDELAPHADELTAHLGEALGDGLTRREVLKLAALLHDVAKPRCRQVVDGRIRFIGHDAVGADMARAIAQRLRLSSAATAVLERLVRHHLRLMHLAQVAEVSRRARYRFFRDLGVEAQDLLLLTLADAAAVRGLAAATVWRGSLGRLVADLLGGLKEDRQQVGAPPLLRGEDVMAAFGLAPGPEVGRLLALAREAQDLGQVRTREEALAYLAATESALDT